MRCLWGAPVVDVADLVDAADGAVGRTALFGEELAFHVGLLVVRDRHAGISALLGAVVHQTELADVEIASAGPAAPIVRLAVGDRLLKMVEARVAAAGQAPDFVPDGALLFS